METDASKAAAMLSSPVSVVGFACASAELPSPRSSGGSSSTRVRSSVSLLSLLLTSQTSGTAAGHRGAAAEDCYDEDASEEDDMEEDGSECSSVAGARRRVGHGAQSEQHAHDAAPPPQHEPLRRAATAPMDVPTAIWLREPLALHELKRLHYERCVRRAQLEALQQQQALAMRHAHLCQQQQVEALQH